MTRVALAFAALEVGGSAADVGLVLAARTLPEIGCVLVGGGGADRTSRGRPVGAAESWGRRLMVAADCARLVSQGAMAALLIAGEAHVWTLALLAAVGGAAT